MYLSFQVQMNQKERVICEFFCLSSSKDDDLISTYTRIENGLRFKRLGLKTSVEIYIFRCEMG